MGRIAPRLLSPPRWTILSIALAGMTARADEPLDLRRYTDIVLRSHPVARENAALSNAARAERSASRLFPDPVFELSLGRGRPLEPGSDSGSERSFTLSQRLPYPGAFSAGIRAAGFQADVFAATADVSRWRLAAEARLRFSQALAARSLLAVAAGQERDARTLLDLVERRAELGEARESDRLKARVEWLKQERARRSAERALLAGERTLRTLAVEPLPEPLQLAGELPSPVSAAERERLLGSLAARNPELRTARSEAARQGALLTQARRSTLPDLDFSIGHQREVDREATSVAFGLRLPLWNANRGEVARTRAAADLASAKAERTDVELRVRLESTLRDLDVASVQLRSLTTDTLPAATESLRLARLLYEEGETSLLDLLDAQRTLRDTEREVIESRLALAAALAEAQELLGPDFDPTKEGQ